MSDNDTPTPRVDANMFKSVSPGEVSGYRLEFECVSVDFARELERETTALRESLAEARKEIQQRQAGRNAMAAEYLALKAELAEAQRKLEEVYAEERRIQAMLHERAEAAEKERDTLRTIAEEGYPGIAHDYEEMRIRMEAAERALAAAKAIGIPPATPGFPEQALDAPSGEAGSRKR